MRHRSVFVCAFYLSNVLMIDVADAHAIEESDYDLSPAAPVSDSSDPLMPAVLEGVIDQFKLWQTGSTLQGCFFDSTPAVRSAFVAAAREWEAYANLEMDFGDSPTFRSCDGGSQIRVSFAPTGNWSYVGTDSIRVDLSKPSMNIQSGNSMGSKVTSAGQFRMTVLHEVGHFLGMQHEHQSPEANCFSEFDWPAIYSAFSKDHGWDKEKVDLNLGTLVKSRRLRTTEYDNRSIMHYYFAPWMFRSGAKSKCYTDKNTDISELDALAIQTAYPEAPSEQLSLIKERLANVRELLPELGLSTAEIDDVAEQIEASVTSEFPNSGLTFKVGDSIQTGDKSPVVKGVNTGGGTFSIEVK